MKIKDPSNEVFKGPAQKKQNQGNKCFFCNKFGHTNKKCTKYHVCCAKKDMSLTLAYFEVNLASVHRNIWWLYSGITINIGVSMHDCLSYRKAIKTGRWIYVENGKSMDVEAIGNFRLLLCMGYYLDLKDTFVVLSFICNLFWFLFWTNLVMFIWK